MKEPLIAAKYESEIVCYRMMKDFFLFLCHYMSLVFLICFYKLKEKKTYLYKQQITKAAIIANKPIKAPMTRRQISIQPVL